MHAVAAHVNYCWCPQTNYIPCVVMLLLLTSMIVADNKLTTCKAVAAPRYRLCICIVFAVVRRICSQAQLCLRPLVRSTKCKHVLCKSKPFRHSLNIQLQLDLIAHQHIFYNATHTCSARRSVVYFRYDQQDVSHTHRPQTIPQS